MTFKKLKYHPRANCGYHRDKDGIHFFSYDQEVAVFYPSLAMLVITENQPFTETTRKHIEFFKQALLAKGRIKITWYDNTNF